MPFSKFRISIGNRFVSGKNNLGQNNQLFLFQLISTLKNFNSHTFFPKSGHFILGFSSYIQSEPVALCNSTSQWTVLTMEKIFFLFWICASPGLANQLSDKKEIVSFKKLTVPDGNLEFGQQQCSQSLGVHIWNFRLNIQRNIWYLRHPTGAVFVRLLLEDCLSKPASLVLGHLRNHHECKNPRRSDCITHITEWPGVILPKRWSSSVIFQHVFGLPSTIYRRIKRTGFW